MKLESLRKHVSRPATDSSQGGFVVLLDRIGKTCVQKDTGSWVKDHNEVLMDFEEAVWVRFQNAPDYVLKKLRLTPGSWNTDTNREGDDTWCGMNCLSGEGLERYIRERRAMETRYAELVAQEPRLACAAVKAACWKKLTLVRGTGPTTENWSYSDDHPGVYTDEASSWSREIAPSLWLEGRHSCGGPTRHWVVVAPL